MLGLSQPRMHVSCLHSHFGTRWSQTRNVGLMIMIKPQCVWVHWNSIRSWFLSDFDFKWKAIIPELLLNKQKQCCSKCWPIIAADTPQCFCVWICIFVFLLHVHKHRQTQQCSACCAHAFKLEAWECTLSSLSLWWRLWCVADQAPGSSGWDVSSFADEGGRTPPSNYQLNIPRSDRWLTEAPACFINI